MLEQIEVGELIDEDRKEEDHSPDGISAVFLKILIFGLIGARFELALEAGCLAKSRLHKISESHQEQNYRKCRDDGEDIRRKEGDDCSANDEVDAKEGEHGETWGGW